MFLCSPVVRTLHRLIQEGFGENTHPNLLVNEEGREKRRSHFINSQTANSHGGQWKKKTAFTFRLLFRTV